jgi:hypothetical protein
MPYEHMGNRRSFKIFRNVNIWEQQQQTKARGINRGNPSYYSV